MKQLTLLLCLLFVQVGEAQDFGWWNERHQWDGFSPWQSYLTVSPRFFGPNALPVPEVQNGLLPSALIGEFSLEGHFTNGDNTQNIYTDVFIPLGDRVGLNLFMVPIEIYQMDTITRDLRRSRDFDGVGSSFGDLNIGTFIQLVKDHEKLPDILLNINLRTASGTSLSAVRFTDSPGYFFDLSFGKSFHYSERKLQSIRPYAMLGFYVWQINGTNSLQNDAISFGAGLQFDFKGVQIDHSWGGYAGYIGDGDKPLVSRLEILKKQKGRLHYQLLFQQGFNDALYTTVRIGTVWELSKDQRPYSTATTTR